MKKPYEAAWYASPLHIPEQSYAGLSIQHKVYDKEVIVVGTRQALLRGKQPVKAVLQTPLTVHQLKDKAHGVWMSDEPEELNQIAEALHDVKPKGDVIIGGLGLGLLPWAMRYQCPKVKSIRVIERNKNIIKLMERSGHLKGVGITVIHYDIFDYLRDHGQRADYYMLDTWQGTNEMTWWEQVMPQKRIIRNRYGLEPEVHCWAEDIMAGQLMRVLMGPNRVWHYKGLPLEMSPKQAATFITNVGAAGWERQYGKLFPKKMK